VGHSTILSGATPSVSGIVGNEWYDRESGRQVSSVSDEKTLLLGVPGKYQGSSPSRMPVSTVGDELKMANAGSKVVSVSIKDRSAILPAGRMADGAYWFEAGVGNFVSSTFYFQKLPAWVEKFNAARSVDQYLNREWLPFDAKAGAKSYRKLGAKADKSYFDALERTPYGNDIVEQFAEAAVEAEHLGEDAIPDLLAVSFSANDRIGHQLGPDAPEVRDVSIQTDRTLGRLLKFLDEKIGADNYIVVMTADHGVAPLPEVMQQRKMPGGRMTEGAVLEAIQVALTKAYGEGKWVVGKSGPAPYLNYELMSEKKLHPEDIQRTAADAVRALPHIFRVYTRTDLMNGRTLDDLIDRRVRNGFHPKRAADLFIVPEPYWLFEAGGTSHGTPYNYDAHVPVIFMGPGIKAGRYTRPIAVNDIAPTLTSLLDVETPSGSSGTPLPEILQ
jgi:predicted AlkP superfamily pyrophosphatase or phosphodiesterase